MWGISEDWFNLVVLVFQFVFVMLGFLGVGLGEVVLVWVLIGVIYMLGMWDLWERLQVNLGG